MIKFREVYYICPNCKDLTTLTQVLDEVDEGSCGMCYCEFNNGRILHKYKRISKKKLEELKSKKEKN